MVTWWPNDLTRTIDRWYLPIKSPPIFGAIIGIITILGFGWKIHNDLPRRSVSRSHLLHTLRDHEALGPRGAPTLSVELNIQIKFNKLKIEQR